MKDNKVYFKSTVTGQVYELDFIPKGFNWEESTKEEYNNWMIEHGLI